MSAKYQCNIINTTSSQCCTTILDIINGYCKHKLDELRDESKQSSNPFTGTLFYKAKSKQKKYLFYKKHKYFCYTIVHIRNNLNILWHGTILPDIKRLNYFKIRKGEQK